MPESSSDSNSGKSERKGALKIAGTLSTVLWIVGFILPFVLPPDSPYVWTSDTFLLIGFWPLLFFLKAGWPWVVFGLLNMAIGFLLELSKWLVYYAGDSVWTAERMAFKPMFMQMHEHISSMHPCMPWLLIGAVSTIYGAFRIIKTIVAWSLRRLRKS